MERGMNQKITKMSLSKKGLKRKLTRLLRKRLKKSLSLSSSFQSELLLRISFEWSHFNMKLNRIFMKNPKGVCQENWKFPLTSRFMRLERKKVPQVRLIIFCKRMKIMSQKLQYIIQSFIVRMTKLILILN
jgi:hypothetical protein